MKRKRFSFLTLLILAVILLMPVTTQAAAKKPGTVKLSSIKATDYNKINIKWKKASEATNYIVYYRESGDKKWIKVKTLDNKKTSYTHTSSSKYPIIVGKKYQYTVKAYNKKTKKSGKYNTKGLTAATIPQTVKLISATYDKDTEGVTISWKKAGGANKYIVYIRNKNNTEWLYLGDTTKTSYVDEFPYTNCDNIYTVVGCVNRNNVRGKYNTNGIKVFVPSGDDGDDDNDNPYIPETTPVPQMSDEQFAAEIFRLTNIERTKHGEPLVQTNDDLNRAAMQRAREISIKFSHTRPDGTNALTVFEEYNHIPDNEAAENIAAGFTSPQDVVDGWMGSSGHRVALLNTYSTHLGVGVCKSGSTYYCVQLFTAYGEKEKLTIDANSGYFPTLNNVSVYDMYFYHGTKIKLPSSLPVPVKEGFTFNGWVDDYGIKDASIRIVSAERLHATWK
jgi:hypothetical protein